MNSWKQDSRKLIFKVGDYFIKDTNCNQLLLKLIFKCGYALNYNLPYSLLTNKSVLHMAVMNTNDISVISDIINVYSKVRMDTSDIETAIYKGYEISENSPIYIRTSSYFLSLYLKQSLKGDSFNRVVKLALVRKLALGEAQSRLNELIQNKYDLLSLDKFVIRDPLVYIYTLIHCEQLDEVQRYDEVTKIINTRDNSRISNKEILFAIKLGYEFSEQTPYCMKNNDKALHLALLKELKSNDKRRIERITNIIDYASYHSTQDIKLAINNGYKYSEKSPYYLKNSSDMIHYALSCTKKMDLPVKLKRINEIMRYIEGNITLKDLNYIISVGYKIPPHPRYYLLDCNQKVITRLLIQTNNPNIIDLSMSKVSDENIVLAFRLGYQLTEQSSSVIRANPLAIHLELLKLKNKKDIDKQMDINRIINLAIGSIYDNDIDYVLSHGYKVSSDTPPTILNDNERMYGYFDKCINISGGNKVGELSDKINSLSKKIGYGQINLLYDKLFKYHKFIKMYSVDDLYNIVRYVYLGSKDAKTALEIILKNDYIDQVNAIYGLFNKDAGLNKIKLFKKICIKYLEYQELCDDFINNMDIITSSDKILLYKLLIEYEFIPNISSLLELRNWKSVIYNEYKNTIEASDEFELKNIIFRMLCNKKYYEVNDFINNIFDTKRIDRLLLTINDQAVRDSLLMYRAFMEYLENINQIQDKEHLRKIATTLTKLNLGSSEALNIIMNHFNNIDTKVKFFYCEEIREMVTDFQALEHISSKGICVTKQKYCASDITIDGENLHGRLVDYIELDGYPFVGFAHTLNAFGSGGKITDFKNERLVGKSYICLSAFSDKYLKFARGTICGEEHITLLFSKFSSDQLITFSYKDLLSNGLNNDLDVKLESASAPVLAPLKDIIDATKVNHLGYNEYIMYRDGLYPNAILVRGIQPRKKEIDAAAYLGVPLVKIHKSKYRGQKKEESTSKLQDENNDEIVKKELYDLKILLEKLQALIYEQGNDESEIKRVMQ